jgi:putative phosphoesterase
MPKLGIISDIHANIEGLDKALALLKAAKVDKIICAGDLLERGRDGDAVVQRIQDEGIPCVLGNHDMLIRKNQRYCLKFPERFPDYPVVSEESIAFAESLPPLLHFDFAGKRICLTHGAPWDVDTYVFLRQPPPQFKRVIDEARADIVILGHTHQPMLIEIENKLILNAGSTLSNHLPLSIMLDEPPLQRSCGILSFPDLRFQVFDIDTGKALNVPYRQIE